MYNLPERLSKTLIICPGNLKASMLYTFADHSLDTELLELRHGEQLIAVEPQVYQVLLYLIQHRDQAVSKDQLLDHVWAGRIVSEATLTNCIKLARQAIGDSGEQQSLIRTVRGHGYRFVGDLQADDQNGTADLALEGLVSIVILPFQVFSDNPELAFFADALVEDLTTIIARVSGLQVISRSSAFSYKQQPPSIAQVREDLDVSHAIEGSVRTLGKRIRINLQLIDVTTQAHVWAHRFDSEEDSLENIEDEIIQSVARLLEPQLTRLSFQRLPRHQANRDAHRNFLYAGGLLATKGWHEDTFLEADKALQQCLEIDPDYALAHAYRALLLGLGHRVGLLANREAAINQCLACSDAALQLDDMNSVVLGFVGCALADIGHIDRAMPLLRKAVEQDPSNAQAWVALGAAEICNQNLSNAIKYMRKGMRISPLDNRLAVWGSFLAIGLMMNNEAEAAVDEAQLACQRDTKNYLPQVTLAVVLTAANSLDAAKKAIADARSIRPLLGDADIQTLFGDQVLSLMQKTGVLG